MTTLNLLPAIEPLKVIDSLVNDKYAIYNGDSCEVLRGLPSNSIHFSVFSPPFSAVYVYSDSPRDLGNNSDLGKFMLHFRFIARELLRVMMPGRVLAMHIQDVQETYVTHGQRQCQDLSGATVKMFKKAGWLYQGRFTIQKNPQTQASRNKVYELMFETMRKDRANLRPTFADFVLLFKKPGDNLIPVTGDYSENEWILRAHPCWVDIRETKVLNAAIAKEDLDEKHMCTLQEDLVEILAKLYSNKGEVILTPFMGIGTEVIGAVLADRRGVGIELKQSYFRTAVKLIAEYASKATRQPTLFDLAAAG